MPGISVKKLFAVVLTSICLINPLNSNSSAASFNDTGCLKLKFSLSKEINLNSKEFKRAAEYVKAGETKKAESEILKAILHSHYKYRLIPWGYSDNAVSEAREILNNNYKFELYAKTSVPLKSLWKGNKARAHSTWAYYVFSFDFFRQLNDAYRETHDNLFIDRAAELTEEFEHQYKQFSTSKYPLSWYDHPVANRASYLVDFWKLFKDSGKADTAFTAPFLELIWRHAKFLENKRNYNSQTNHGIFASYSLFRIAVAFPWFRESPLWKRIAVNRMEQQIRDNFTLSGIHREYSPYYQLAMTGVLERFREDCRHNRIELSQRFNKTVSNAINALPWFLYPDGSIALFGDSDDRPREGIIRAAYRYSSALRYIDSGGKRGKIPRVNDMAFADAKFFVMRSGWGKHRKLRDESCLIANFTERAKSHEHQDFLSFELYARGKKWITDLGRWLYEYDKPERKYIISAQAHNVIVPYCFKTQNRARVKESISRKNELVREYSSKKIAYNRPGSKLIYQLKNSPLKEKRTIERFIDSINKLKGKKEKIEAYEALLRRNPRWCEDKIIISLATVLSGSHDNLPEAVRLLERVIAKGTDSPYYQVALELKSTFMEDLSKNKKKETQSQVEKSNTIKQKIAKLGKTSISEKVTNIKVLKKRFKDKGKKTTPIVTKSVKRKRAFPGLNLEKPLIEIKPARNNTPLVIGWENGLKYDYLEGTIQFKNRFFHKRAILFIKPYYFLIVDNVNIICSGVTKQLFHMPPDIEVRKTKEAFELVADDSSRCLVYSIYQPKGTTSRIVKGKKGNRVIDWQGWYSGTFNNFVEAPVIENSVTEQEYYIVTLFVPIGKENANDYAVNILNKNDWDPSRQKPLKMEIVAPRHKTTVCYKPSSRFLSSLKLGSFDPVISVKRRKR